MYITECSIEDCHNYVSVRGWCQKHYSTWRRNGDPLKTGASRSSQPDVCIVDDCQTKPEAKGLCKKHYHRNRNNGSPYIVQKVVGEHRNEHPLYKSYHAMLDRCYNLNNQKFEYYGGRGISVHERWRGLQGFSNFLIDMGDRPKGKTLDRIDNDGNYEPSNCKWSTRSEQQYNRRKASNNTSGHIGISLFKKTGKWQAYVYRNKKRKHLGYYATLEEAVIAREKELAHGKQRSTDPRPGRRQYAAMAERCQSRR